MKLWTKGLDGRWWVVAGATAATSVAAVDLLSRDLTLVGLLSVGPLIAGLRAHLRGTAVVAAYALLLALASGIPDGMFGTKDHAARVLVVLVAGVMAGRMAVLRDRARQAGIESRNVVHSVFHSALDCIVSMDGDGRVVDLNRAAEQTFGYDRDDAIGRELCELIIPERHRDAHREGLARMARAETPRVLGRRIEVEAMRVDGREFPAELTVTQASVEPCLYTGFVRDITERHQADAERERARRHATFLANAGALLESSLDYETTIDHIARLAVPGLADWAFVEMVQPDGSIKRAAMAHTDLSKEALVREYDERYPLDPEAPEGSPKVIRTGRAELMKEIPDEMLEAVAQDERHLEIMRELGFRSAMVVPLRAHGRVLGDIALVSAESGRVYDEAELALTQELASRCALAIDNARLYAEAREQEDKLRHQALHDPLTGLPNRTLLLDRLEMALARAGRSEGQPALMFLDLDGFKAVNDAHGHRSGDELLAAIPERLEGPLRSADTVSRFGGDEFVVLCEDVSGSVDAIAIAERVIAAVEQPFVLKMATVDVRVSLGIAFASGSEETAENLLRKADTAMYEAKRRGTGYATFSAETTASATLAPDESVPYPLGPGDHADPGLSADALALAAARPLSPRAE